MEGKHMKKQSQKLLAFFLAVVLALPLGMLATFGVHAEEIEDTTTNTEEKFTEPTVTSSDATSFSFNKLGGAKYATVGEAFKALPNGGTIRVPVKGYVSGDATVQTGGPVLITAKKEDGTLYYNPANPAVDGDQAGMFMVAALKTMTFNSDVIFDDIVILQRGCLNESNVANLKISNGATMVIGENVQFLYSKTANKALYNSRLTVDTGATLVLKAGGAQSYSGKGTIYVDKDLIGNGIEMSQFSKFVGNLYDLEGNPLCYGEHHVMGAKLVDGEYISVCLGCGYTENEPYVYTIPEVTSDAIAFWGNDTAAFKNAVGSSVTTVMGGSQLLNGIPNGGTVYPVQKGYIGDNFKLSFGSTVKFTAILPDNFAEIVGYTGDAELNLDLREKDVLGNAAEQNGSIMTHTDMVLVFESDVIFEHVNFYNRTAPGATYAIANGATAVFNDVQGLTNIALRPVIEVKAGGTAIFLGDNIGGFAPIVGEGTVIVDPELFKNGKFNAATFANFEGTVLTTEYEEVCAITGNHNFVDGICQGCGWEDGSSLKYYVKDGGKGDGTSPESPANSMRTPFTLDVDTPIEIILVDDLIINGAITCEGSKQDITITSMDVDGDGVYPKLIIKSYIIFKNSGAGNTIKFENIEICSDKNMTVPLFLEYNNFVIGEGVSCTLSGTYGDTADLYPTLYLGYLEIDGEDTVENRSNSYDGSITVNSGTWRVISGGNRRGGDTVGHNSGKVTINVGGGTILGDSYGIAISGSGFNYSSGDVEINVTGGDISGNIYGVGFIGTYGGANLYGAYGYKGDIAINVSGATLNGNIYAQYYNIKAPSLVRGSVDVVLADDVVLPEGFLVDLRGTEAYAGEDKVSTLTYSDTLSEYVSYKFVDYVNDTATGAGEPIRVGFVGDSITQGTGSTDASKYSYPAYIQAMLDSDEYMVGNFGVGASGVLPSTKYYYNDTLQYHLLMEEFDPQIMSFALGTNDCLSAGGTKGVAEDFENRYYALIKGVAELDSVEKIYVATPILRLDSPSRQARNVSIVEPAIRRIVAALCSEGFDATLFELNANTYEAVLAGQVLAADNLHPHDAGYAIMAEAFYAAIFEGACDVPEGYYVDTFYVSNNGSLTGAGTIDDPSTHYEIGLARLNKNGGELVILDNYDVAADIMTPTDIAKITIRGYNADATLTWGGNTMKFGSDFEIDELTLITTSNAPSIIGWYNNATIGENFNNVTNGTADVVFVAGYLVYKSQDIEGAFATTTYDSVHSASSDKDISIIIKNGTFGQIVLGNRRQDAKAPIGNYSGNMTVQLLGGKITGYCDSGYASGCVAMTNLSGSVDVSLDGIAIGAGIKFYVVTRTATLSEVVYDASLNTGSVTISAAASVIENHVAYSEKPVGDPQYAHLENYEIIYTTEKGDMDEDGNVTNADVALLIRALAGWDDVSYANYSADMNADSKINNRDALEIIKIMALIEE